MEIQLKNLPLKSKVDFSSALATGSSLSESVGCKREFVINELKPKCRRSSLMALRVASKEDSPKVSDIFRF